MRYPARLLALLLYLSPLVARSHPDHAPAEEMATAAADWLAALTPAQRQQAVFPVANEERENWHFVPRARRGVPLKAMTEPQRDRARALVASALSQRGQLATEAIIALEDVLLAMEGNTRRDRGLYYFTVFGEPGDAKAWGWRLEGHHLSLNVLVVAKEHVAVTPMFFGSNPAEVRIDHAQKGQRTLAAEEDLGRALLLALDPAQQAVALIAPQAPADIITGNDRVARLAAPAGLAYARMTPAQQEALRALVEVYAQRLRPELAALELRKIADRGWDAVHFAWAGGRHRGEAHYYRIHGPHFVIEYDNIQNEANHIHTTWRDFDGDFGRDLLREHYAADHAAR